MVKSIIDIQKTGSDGSMKGKFLIPNLKLCPFCGVRHDNDCKLYGSVNVDINKDIQNSLYGKFTQIQNDYKLILKELGVEKLC